METKKKNTKKETNKSPVSPLVESLTGVLSSKCKKYKKEYSDYLVKKYS